MVRFAPALTLPLATSTATRAAHVGDAPLEVADAGLARVRHDDLDERLLGDGDRAPRESPCSLSCFGMRWLRAMWTFSSNV